MCGILRAAALALFTATLLPAWLASVEFPFTALPRVVWEAHLAHLKQMGVTHVSLPPANSAAQLDEVIRIVRSLGFEADLEGPIPERLAPLAKAHGGPLSEMPAGAVRISARMRGALDNERKLVAGGTPAIVWTDVFDTLIPGYRPGAIDLSENEAPGAALVRREVRLARLWGTQLSSLPEADGARLTTPVAGVRVRQYIADKTTAEAPAGTPPSGLSFASVANDSPAPWKGEVRVMYPALQRVIALPGVSVASRDVLWLPVNIPLVAGPLCQGCTGFAPSDHLAYATAELSGMEYENGILAMEFIARSPGEAVLQLSHEPTGPLIAAGHPSVFDWDPKTFRARLPIPPGDAKTGFVRVALAVDAPQATAFFQDASVLLIGESNRLTAEFSPRTVAERARVRSLPAFPIAREKVVQSADKDEPAFVTCNVTVPPGAVDGDTAELSIDADGVQLSHLSLRLTAPVAVTFDDAVAVRVSADSFVALWPSSIPVSQKSGRQLVLRLRNNAPEIRTFQISLSAPGLDFSPAKQTVSIGASLAREVTFRVFGGIAATGVHEGEVRVSGAAALAQPVSFVVLPPAGEIAWSSEGFSILESAKLRASFLDGRWLEMIDKDAGRDAQPPGGTEFSGGPAEKLKLEDLQKLAPRKPPAPRLK